MGNIGEIKIVSFVNNEGNMEIRDGAIYLNNQRLSSLVNFGITT